MSTELHPMIEQRLATHDATRACILAANDTVREADEMIADHAGVFKYMSAHIGIVGEVWIGFHAKSMADVIACRRWWAARGYHITGRYEHPEDMRETHTLRKADGRQVTLNISFPDESSGAACKYVKTGTKEVPVYELRCEGAAP